MEKLKMQSKNLTEGNIAELAKLFPNCVTEGKVDFDLLRQELSSVLVEGKDERYRLDWSGKRQAILTANSPIAKTLRPARADSVNFDATENLYIEGDNLDVLKLLGYTYQGKVKMIYIDPPYNTGNDFVYNDDFAEDADEYLIRSSQKDEQGNRLATNKETSGRYHSDWLSMMFMRLRLAKNLLTADGVIFISIDNNEQANLKRLCDEVFGEDSFVTVIHCQLSTTQGMKVKAAQDGNIVKNGEYILCYSKSGKKNIAIQPLYDLRPEYDEHYSLYLKENGQIAQLRELYDFRFPKDLSNKKPLGLAEAFKRSEEFADIVRSHLADIVCSDKMTGVDITSDLKNGEWKRFERNGKEYLLTLDQNGKVRQLLRLKDSWGKTDGFKEPEGLRKIRGDWWDGFYIDMGNVAKEGGVDYKNGKKPVRLIKQLAKMITTGTDTILDFFSGSATTAHAVMQLNAEDGGKRKHIMVQIPESIDEKQESYSFLKSLGKPTVITELGKERIRRAGSSLTDLTNINIDIGFRVLKLDDSNMRDIRYNPKAYDQSMLIGLDNSIKEDRTAEDVLFQVMLDKGVLLSSKIEKRTTANGQQTYYIVGSADFGIIDLVCVLDKKVNTEAVKEIAKLGAECVVFLDSGMADDATRTNVQQIFTTYSPKTKVEVL